MKLAQARSHIPGKMNKTEQRYSLLLQDLVQRKIVAHWGFEALKLKLADRTFYTPDFMVLLCDGGIEFHEVKATWKAAHQDDSRVKIKVAAQDHQWARFTSYEMNTSHREWFGPHGAALWSRK